MPSQLAVKALQQSLPTLHTLMVLHCTIRVYLLAQTFLLRLNSHDYTYILMPLVVLGMLSLPSQGGTLIKLSFATASHSLTVATYLNWVIHTSHPSPSWYGSRIISGLLGWVTSIIAAKEHEHRRFNLIKCMGYQFRPWYQFNKLFNYQWCHVDYTIVTGGYLPYLLTLYMRTRCTTMHMYVLYSNGTINRIQYKLIVYSVTNNEGLQYQV